MRGSRVERLYDVEVLALLPLPDLDTRTDDQTRGRTCVWDSTPLIAETAIDLGERMSPLDGSASLMRWFPRACTTCVREAATAAIRDHTGTCEQCTDNAALCEIRAALEQLTREGR